MVESNFEINKPSSSLSVGISGTLIDASHVSQDGIGHFTQQLIHQLDLHNIETTRYGFQPFYGKIKFERSLSMDHSFALSALLGMITRGKCLKFNPRIDIFHSTDFKVIPMRCPVVATVWDAIPHAHPEWVANCLKARYSRQLVKQSLHFADHFITASHHAAQDIVKYYKIDEKDITVIPCGIDDHWYKDVNASEAKQTLEKYGLKEKGYFLCVGTLQPRKNHHRLIDAYLALPSSIRKERKLVIVGKYGWDSEGLVNRIQLLKQNGQVVWLHNVTSDEDLRMIYSGAGIFIFPSLYEGFGLPVVEAFASGIPVISSNATSLPEVSQGTAIEIRPKSTASMIEAMQFLATSDSEREKRVQLGLIRAEQYRWKNILPLFIDAYKTIIKTSKKNK